MIVLHFIGHPPIEIESDVPKCVCGSADIVLDATPLSNGRTGCVCRNCRCGFEMAYAKKMIDPKNYSYEELEAMITDAPNTFIPALLIAAVKAGYAKKVFQPSGASKLAANVEAKNGWDLK